MTIAELIAKYNTVGTGLFRTGQSRGIASDDMRDFVTDITTLTDIPVDLSSDFLPTSGAVDLAGTVTVDGNDHDIIFGDPNSLDEFQVNVNNNLHLHAYDGVDHTHVSLHPAEFSVLSENSEVVLTPILFSAIVNEGADSSTIDLSAVLLDIVTTDITATVEGLSVTADDGVDSSSLSLTPLGLDIDFLAGGVTELNGDWNIANTAQAHSVIFGPDYLTTFDPLATFYAEAENIQLVSDVFYLASYSGVEIRALTNNGVALVVHDNESNDILKCEEIGGLRYTTITGLIKLPSYITANLPTVSEGGLFAFCTDEVGGEVPVFTNNSGTWLRVTDGSPPVGP